MIVSSFFCSSHFLIFPCLIRQAMSEQDSDYPGTPSDAGTCSTSSGFELRGCRMEFKLRFLNGTSISLEADYEHSVGWVMAKASQHLAVSARYIRICRGTTPLSNLSAKVFDVLGVNNELSVMAYYPEGVSEAD